MTKKTVAVLGATGMTGSSLLPKVVAAGWNVVAFTRAEPVPVAIPGVGWYHLGQDRVPPAQAWISTIPLWLLPDYFDTIAASGATRIVTLSSTSRFSKSSSPEPEERALAGRLAASEEAIISWARDQGIEWVILRPTMIYGGGRDHNVSSMIRFIRRYGFLPVLGRARGLRQPVHVEDVAWACVAALSSPGDRAYNLSGGETLSYGELGARLFQALDRRPRLVRCPEWLFRLVKPLGRLLPARLRWLVAMVERMNCDLVFDNSDAVRELHFRPRRFELDEADLREGSSRILP